MEIKYKWIYALLLFTNVLINLDHGIIPAASLQIEESLHMSDEELGYLGSLVYAGIVVVGIFGGKLFLKFNAKIIIQISYVGMIISLAIFTQTYGVTWPYYVSRFLTGAAQAPMLIYFPVWVDNFGLESKTLWLTMLQGVIPLGIFVGYVLSSVISGIWKWNISFYMQVVLLIPSFLLFFFVKTSDFDIKRQTKQRIEKKASKMEEDLISIVGHTTKPYWQLMKELISIKVWLCMTIAISVLYFIVTGIQFWMSNYMIQVLNQPKPKVNTVFSVISITAPVLGCIVGGMMSQHVGGYENIKSMYLCLIYSSLACICAAPVPFLNGFWSVAGLIWLLLFFGGATVPPVTGIMLTSVPPKLRAFANSNTTTFYNLFGFLPAPSVYGLMTRFGDRAGLIFIMYVSFLGLMSFILGVIFKRSQVGQKHKVRTASSSHDVNRTLKSSIAHENDEETYHITEQVLQYNQMPMSVSLMIPIDNHKAEIDHLLDEGDEDIIEEEQSMQVDNEGNE